MSTVLPGTQVSARGLQWEVVHTEPAGEQQRFRLRCIQGDLRGEEFDLLHPLEEVTPVSTELDPTRAGRLKQWLLYHQAFLLEQALGPNALVAVQPGRLEIAPYQLVPVMRALRMSRPRLLLADGVGLGKTIQAGLVMAELIAQRRAHRILIVSPAGPLLNRWHREMRTRFGLRFTAIKDAGELQEARRGLVLGANPFDHVSFCLTSIDFAKQEKVLQDLERTCWDLVVIDEAHHCVRMGRAGDWEDSRRRRLAELLARQTDGLLLLTATPHDGYDPHFASIVDLLDPSLLNARGNLRGEGYRKHVVRRLKQHIKDAETVKRILDRYCELTEKGEEQAESRKQRLRTLRDYRRRLERYGTLSWEEEQDHADLEAEEMAAELLSSGTNDLAGQIDALQREQRRERGRLRRVDATRGALAELVGCAGEAAKEDPKREAVLREVRSIRQAEPETNILVYTEYTDSQDEVIGCLRTAADGPTSSHGGQRLDTASAEDAARREEAYQAITRLVAERGVITSRDAQEITGLDASRVRPHLQRLVSEGLAVAEGQRRGRKYRRVDHA
ncbi:MAG: DEAD/DEAH box helicase family protein [Candidatus Eisenbacteria sp.]|nr:DEAD/DEAH box helicase family protein [Candidatus Eisenbacteria bacterium]